MKIICSHSRNPYYNLALEEYLLTEFEEEFIFLWRNASCVVIGKNQNTIEEINVEFVNANDISVVRRITGGGAVVHDLGNLNFSVIKNSSPNAEIDIREFTDPVCRFLNQLGVPAQINGRNDIVAGEYKISGNAQTIQKGRILHHGTLLFDADLQMISKALKPSPVKYQSKGIGSVRSRITNISELLETSMGIDEFEQKLFAFFIKENPDMDNYQITEVDEKKILQLENEKYRTWEWNYGKSPKFNFSRKMKFEFGMVEVSVQVEHGWIEQLAIYGDFFGISDKQELEILLAGKQYEKNALSAFLESIDLNEYISGMQKDVFLSLLIEC